MENPIVNCLVKCKRIVPSNRDIIIYTRRLLTAPVFKIDTFLSMLLRFILLLDSLNAFQRNETKEPYKYDSAHTVEYIVL